MCQSDDADKLSRLIEKRISDELGASGAKSRAGDDGEGTETAICRKKKVPEEGLEPPTRGL